MMEASSGLSALVTPPSSYSRNQSRGRRSEGRAGLHLPRAQVFLWLSSERLTFHHEAWLRAAQSSRPLLRSEARRYQLLTLSDGFLALHDCCKPFHAYHAART